MSSLEQLEARIALAMQADRHRLRRQLHGLETALRSGKPTEDRAAELAEEVDRSVAICDARRNGVPEIRYDQELPVAGRREEIARAIRDHQVVIVCGETGSGKSTQLPKICLEMGRGIEGLIGHTQPRRIAARSVAARIAEELGSPLGQHVGFKVRFAESLGPQCFIKLMTDGILLAETQGDPFLDRYDTIILDEAHERSLNIDFLIGYLKRLLPKRPDLRLIITSATIDAARFSEHFAKPERPAPVLEVSGRTFPVEIRWRPTLADDEGDEPDLQEAVLAAIDELAGIDRGDLLIFMPTERDIHETAKALRGRPIPGDSTGSQTDVLPLYARLSIQEQQRVFQPGPRRRIVIATNVAESSLTVPRIHYVIDPGTARISRYSPRSKTQRLPIEAISRASADQRCGRCGRIAPGICIRLFSEEDYLARDRYTVPEIQRTNLAAVILQTKALRLGPIEDFPFLDPPKSDAVRDGYQTLFELGAIDEQQDLTDVGRQLSRLPVDPRIGRMILAAGEEGCLQEMLIIAAALEVQDPRERPLEKQEAADASHVKFADEQSDFLGYLKLWDFYHKLKAELSRNQLRKACRQNFLSYNRIREWLDVHHELLGLVEEAGLKRPPAQRSPATSPQRPQGRTRRAGPGLAPAQQQKHDAIHRAILTGLLSSLAIRGEMHDYSVAGGGKANLWPGSGVFRGKPKWIVAAEVVETTRRYLRTCGRIDPRWIERLAGHLVKRSYSDLHWDPAWASAVALERVTLFGLTIVAGRRVRYGTIDPGVSRQLLIEHGLVEGDLEPPPEFLKHNRQLLDDMERLQAKLRRRDLLVSHWGLYQFYDRQLPAEVCDGASLVKWLRESPQRNSQTLSMTKADLLTEGADTAEGDFPDSLAAGHLELPLDYEFEPGSQQDGVTLQVPLEAINQLDPQPLEWLVPGLLEQKILAMIRSLPKALRTQFVPAPETAKKVVPLVGFGKGNLRGAVAAALSRIGGLVIRPDAFQDDRLPVELRMNVRVTDDEGRTLAEGRDLDLLRRELGAAAASVLTSLDDPQWNRDGITAWDFDELPAEIEVSRGSMTMKGYPALLDRETSVSLRLVDTLQRAEHETRFGLRRLYRLAAHRDLKTQVDWLPGLDRMQLHSAVLVGFDLRQQLTELLADRAFLAEPGLPRSKAEFEARLLAGRQRIGLAVHELAALMGPWFEACHQAHLALQQAAGGSSAPATKLLGQRVELPKRAGVVPQPPAPGLKWQYAVDDVRGQLDRLAGPKCLGQTPWDWLRHGPRYFGAIRFRLESVVAGGWIRDRQGFDEFLPRWEAYAERARQHEAQGIFDPELVQYRWMLEEFRVSLFAQKLGTSVPVSGKRLDQQWSKIST